MALKKLLAGATLLTTILVSGCNLSTQAAAQEVAINLSTLEVSPTLALTPLPTRTPINAAPTLITLGGANVAAQPASLSGTAVPPTQPPPEGQCSLKATGSYDVNVRMGPGTQFKIMSALPAGQYMLVINQSENGWFQIPWGREAVGWVSPKVVTLFGPCDALITQWAADRNRPATLTPTPTAMFGATIGIPQNNIITKVTIGSIPAGTTVMISTAMFTGSGYIYDIMTVDGRFEKATDAQLMFSSGGGLLPFPTPTPYVYAATPTAVFHGEIGMDQRRVVTAAQVGDIPAGTTVQIGSAYFDGTSWKYDIFTNDGRHATASEFQLSYDGTRKPGPTPTAMFGFAMNIPLNRLITKEKVGDIPAGTTVMVTSTQFNGDFYLYGIMAVDGRSAMATDSQLAYSAGGGSMPFPTPTASVPVMELPTDVSPSDVVIPDGMCTVTAKSKTTLYASPNTSTSVVGVMNPGPWAQVGASNGQGWYKVTIWTDGRQGWGNISTLTLHGPCDSLPVETGG